MQVTVEKLSPVLVEVQIQVPADRVRIEVDNAYSSLQRNARVKGFRPGKVPRAVLAHLYGGRVHADVAQRLVDETLHRALEMQRLQPLSQPAIAPTELRPEEAFSYKARFEVRPEITSVKWEGIEVKRPSTTVTEAAIDAELQRLRREHAILQVPAEERPAKVGDVVTVSFRLNVQGKPQGPSEPQEIETEIGSGQMMKELEDAVTGTRAGDVKDVTVTFPERHSNTEFRGKTGVFHLVVKDIRERTYPELDDELAKDCGEDNLDKLRDAQRSRIQRDLTQKASEVVAEQLVVELCKLNPIPVPDSLVEQQAQMTERELGAVARRQGQRFEATAEIKARVRADAEMKVRAGLLMAEIAREKQIQVTDEDIEKGYVELAEQTGKNVAKVRAEYRDAKKRETLVAMILEDKILDIIENMATVTSG